MDVRPGEPVELSAARMAAVRALINGAYGKHPDTRYFVGTTAVGLRRADYARVHTLAGPSGDGVLVMEKSDGVRYLLVLGRDDGQSFSYLVDRNYGIYDIGVAVAERRFAGTVLDGELVRAGRDAMVYLAFDVVACDGPSLRALPLRERREVLFRILPAQDENAPADEQEQAAIYAQLRAGYAVLVDNSPSIRAMAKRGDSLVNVARVLHGLQALKHANDGLTLAALGAPIQTGRSLDDFKWKPNQSNSLDARLLSRRSANGSWSHQLFFRQAADECSADALEAGGRAYSVALATGGDGSADDLLPLMEERAWERTRNSFNVVVELRCTIGGTTVGGGRTSVSAVVVGIRRDKEHGNDVRTAVGTLVCLEEAITAEELVHEFGTNRGFAAPPRADAFAVAE